MAETLQVILADEDLFMYALTTAKEEEKLLQIVSGIVVLALGILACIIGYAFVTNGVFK